MSQENDIEHSMSANDVSGVLADQSEVLLDTNGENHFNESHDEQWQERESRNALKHVSGLGEKSVSNASCSSACGPVVKPHRHRLKNHCENLLRSPKPPVP